MACEGTSIQTVIYPLYAKWKICQKNYSAASLYLGMQENWLPEMAVEGNTIMRLIHYPPTIGAEPGALDCSTRGHQFHHFASGSTASGLQVLTMMVRHLSRLNKIVVDSGDMIQNLTNGLFKSTTSVVNPEDNSTSRYSMPMFVHPSNEII